MSADTPSPICILDRSGAVAPGDVLDIWISNVKQLREEFCSVHGIPAPECHYAATPEQVPAGCIVTQIERTSDEPGAAAYHFVDDRGVPAAKAFLDGGELSVLLGHELLEMTWDPYCNIWRPARDGFSYAQEACDATQGDTYEIDGIKVPNFLYESFFDPDGKAPYDRLGLITKPFETRPGGYQIRDRGDPVWGAAFPEHMKAGKLLGRLAERRAAQARMVSQ